MITSKHIPYKFNSSVQKDIVKETVTIVVVPLSSSRFPTIQSNSYYLVHSCRVSPQNIQRHFSRWVASKAGTSSEVRMVVSYTRYSKMT